MCLLSFLRRGRHMRISQEAYDRMRARLDASEERFNILQQSTNDWYGQPSIVVLQTVRLRRHYGTRAGRHQGRLTRAGTEAGGSTDDFEPIEILPIDSHAADVSLKAVFH